MSGFQVKLIVLSSYRPIDRRPRRFHQLLRGPYDDGHERRAVVYDNKGHGIVFYKPLGR